MALPDCHSTGQTLHEANAFGRFAQRLKGTPRLGLQPGTRSGLGVEGRPRSLSACMAGGTSNFGNYPLREEYFSQYSPQFYDNIPTRWARIARKSRVFVYAIVLFPFGL